MINIVVILITAGILVCFIFLFFFSYRYYLNKRIQNQCKKICFMEPRIFLLLMVIILLGVCLGISIYDNKQLNNKNIELTNISNKTTGTVFNSVDENSVYSIYTDGILKDSLSGYTITKEVKDDFECYYAYTKTTVSQIANYIIYIQYTGELTELNGYLKYSIDNGNAFSSDGNIDKKLIVLASSIEKLPMFIEIGLSDSMDKTEENYNNIITFSIAEMFQ